MSSQLPVHRLPDSIRPTFHYARAEKYKWQEIKGFLQQATENNDNVGPGESTHLKELWDKIFKPFFEQDDPEHVVGNDCTSCKVLAEKKHWNQYDEPTTKLCFKKLVQCHHSNIKKSTRGGIKTRKPKNLPLLEPINTTQHGVGVEIFTLYCALAAVFTITLTPPSVESKKYHEDAFALARLLAKWIQELAPKIHHPSKVCVMYGIDNATNNIIWVCGTSKLPTMSPRAKSQMRDTRSELVLKSVHLSFDAGREPVRNAQDVLERFCSTDADETQQDIPGDPERERLRRIINQFRERSKEIGRVPLRLRDQDLSFGDCAETVPLAIINNRCTGALVSICVELTRGGAIKLVPPCNSCLLLFSTVEVISKETDPHRPSTVECQADRPDAWAVFKKTMPYLRIGEI